MRREAGLAFESAAEIAARQSALIRDFGDRRVAAQVGLDEFVSAPQLPGGQSAACKAFDRETAIDANDMSKKRERDILAKHRRAVAGAGHRAGERLGKPVHDQVAPAELPGTKSFDSRNPGF